MAETLQSNLAAVESQTQTNFVEELVQVVDVFNGASAGTMTIGASSIFGDVPETNYWEFNASGHDFKRDLTSTSARTKYGMTQDTVKSVVLRRHVALDASIGALKSRGITMESYLSGAGVALARQVQLTAANAGVGAAVGAISSESGYTNDDSGGSNTVNVSRINDTKLLMGDARGKLRAMFVHSTPFSALLAEGIGSSAVAYQSLGNAELVGDEIPAILGMRPVLCDDDALDVAGPDYFTLMLTEGAVMLEVDNFMPIRVFEDLDGDQALIRHYGEYDLKVTVKGGVWNGTGGDNPAVSALATAANWDFAYDDVKQGPGVVLKTDG